MRADPFQLSHEELLVLLGLLDLPAPLSLGPHPAAGYASPGAQALLVGALGSLVARDFVEPARERTLAVAPRIASTLRACALAESCLVIVERRGAVQRTRHLNAADGALVLHSSPLPRVHRFEPLAGVVAAREWLADAIGVTPSAALVELTAPATALQAALDAVDDGAPDDAQALLVGTGADVCAVQAFIAALGAAPGRFALGAVRGLRDEAAEARGCLAISGAHGAWCCLTPPQATALHLHPVCPSGMRHELDATLTWLGWN
jgi:hypothetical protein